MKQVAIVISNTDTYRTTVNIPDNVSAEEVEKALVEKGIDWDAFERAADSDLSFDVTDITMPGHTRDSDHTLEEFEEIFHSKY